MENTAAAGVGVSLRVSSVRNYIVVARDVEMVVVAVVRATHQIVLPDKVEWI